MINNKNKLRRLNAEDQVTSTSTKKAADQVMRNEHSLNIEHLPNEILGIIMDMTPRKEVYPILRGVSRQFYKLTQ